MGVLGVCDGIVILYSDYLVENYKSDRASLRIDLLIIKQEFHHL